MYGTPGRVLVLYKLSCSQHRSFRGCRLPVVGLVLFRKRATTSCDIVVIGATGKKWFRTRPRAGVIGHSWFLCAFSVLFWKSSLSLSKLSSALLAALRFCVHKRQKHRDHSVLCILSSSYSFAFLSPEGHMCFPWLELTQQLSLHVVLKDGVLCRHGRLRRNQ